MVIADIGEWYGESNLRRLLQLKKLLVRHHSGNWIAEPVDSFRCDLMEAGKHRCRLSLGEVSILASQPT